MEHRIEELAGFSVVGLAVECTHEDISGIGPLWDQFFKRFDEIKDNRGVFGVCFDKPDGFTYLAAACVAGGDAPGGMVARDVPAATYAVYNFHGPAQEMSKVFAEIFETRLPAAGLKFKADCAVLERYPADCWDEATRTLKADLLIPVEH